MKIKISLIVVALALSPIVHADTPKGLGIHAGLNLADVSMNSSISTSTMTGLQVGASYDSEFAPDLSFVPGVQLIQRGFGFDVGMTAVDLKITYLEFPLLFQARFRGASIVPFFTGGPVLGLKMGTSCSVSGGDCTVYDDSQVKTLHMGLDIGGGAIFPLENGAGISAQLRYHLGLTTVAGGISDPRHRGLLMQVGYLF